MHISIRFSNRLPAAHRRSTFPYQSAVTSLTRNVQGLCLEEWAPGIQIEAELPYHSIKTDRPYSAITYDVETRHLVAASVLHRDFAIFDDEAVPLWTPDGMSD